MLVNKDVQKAKKFLRGKGYGSGTNYTTNSVAYLIAEYHDEAETNEKAALNIGIVTNRTLKCNRCGAIYSLDAGETFGCCVAVSEHRTSQICCGELIVID